MSNLHGVEEDIRQSTVAWIERSEEAALHVEAAHQAMDICDMLRQIDAHSEDEVAIRILALRVFNDLAASLKLCLSGYNQLSCMVLRDLMETVFLLDLMSSDRSLIEKWRTASTKKDKKPFSPIEVRITLDERDGFTEKKRQKAYKLLSEYAAHPSPVSDTMLRDETSKLAHGGPFFDKRLAHSTLSEMGKLAVQAGGILIRFAPHHQP